MYWEGQDPPPPPLTLMGQTLGIKLQILYFGLLSPSLLLLELLNVLGGHRNNIQGCLERSSDLPPPPYGSDWGHKIADFVF